MADIVMKNAEIRPLRCLIVDDELIAIKDIASNIEQINFLIVEDTCSSAIEAAEILKRGNIDIMFLDINMPYLSGIEFLESLDKAPLTILSTAYSEYALDGYRLNVIDYLLKPISFQRFFQAVQKHKGYFRHRFYYKT
nr:response regulator [Bacteroides fragilis]